MIQRESLQHTLKAPFLRLCKSSCNPRSSLDIHHHFRLEYSIRTWKWIDPNSEFEMARYGVFPNSWNQSFWLALLWRWWRKQRFTIHALTTNHSWHLSSLSSVQKCLVAWYEMYARNREEINKSIYVFFWLRIKYASPIDENSIYFNDPSNNRVRVSFFSMPSSAERNALGIFTTVMKVFVSFSPIFSFLLPCWKARRRRRWNHSCRCDG